VNRRHRFYSVLHGKEQQANAGGSISKCRFGMDDEGKKERKNERKKESEAKRRQTQGSSAVASATAAPQA